MIEGEIHMPIFRTVKTDVTQDSEMQVIIAVQGILNDLSLQARRRVLQYLLDRDTQIPR